MCQETAPGLLLGRALLTFRIETTRRTLYGEHYITSFMYRGRAANRHGHEGPRGRAMRVHPSITEERITDAGIASTFGLAQTGICVACGSDQDGVEPDARAYKCESCGQRAVYGAQELLSLPVA